MEVAFDRAHVYHVHENNHACYVFIGIKERKASEEFSEVRVMSNFCHLPPSALRTATNSRITIDLQIAVVYSCLHFTFN